MEKKEENEGYCLKTPEGIWRFKCPECGFQFARSDEEISGPVDCPRCSAKLIVRGKISSTFINKKAGPRAFWKQS